MPLSDELCSAIEVLQGPSIEGDVGLGHTAVAALVLALPLAIGTLVEAQLLLWFWRVAGDRAVSAALAVIGILLAVGALFPALLPFIALVVMPLQGVTCGIAQATVVAEDTPDRGMARWAVSGSIGDVAGPLMFGAIAYAGGGWRATFAAVAVVFLAQAVATAGVPASADTDDDELPEGLVALGRGLLADRPLLKALVAASLCSLLDETLLVFGGLWMAERGDSPTVIGAVFAAHAVGAVLGSLAVEPLIAKLGADRLLRVACVCSALAVGAWIAIGSHGALFAIGLFTAPLYPLAEARAYKVASPARVAAGSQLVAALDVVWPLVLGLVADRYGLRVALLVLLVQPVGLFFAARRPSTR